MDIQTFEAKLDAFEKKTEALPPVERYEARIEYTEALKNEALTHIRSKEAETVKAAAAPTKEQILSIQDDFERREAVAANIHLFQRGAN